jgi:hypothetical protein
MYALVQGQVKNMANIDKEVNRQHKELRNKDNARFRLCKGPSTRVRICVRIAVGIRARFVFKPNRDPILYLTPITMACIHILTKTNIKLACWTRLAANRTRNRMPIRTQNCTCRRPLNKVAVVTMIKALPYKSIILSSMTPTTALV